MEAPPVAQRMPGWLRAPASTPFSLGGVQRKVQIGASNDPYERQADQVASHVSGGLRVPPGTISPIAPASLGAAQRESKPAEEQKKKEPPSGGLVQKKTQDKKRDEKSATPVQRAVKPEDTKKDIKSAGAQLQRAAKPEDRKKEEKPASAAPVQKQAKPEDKKKDEKPGTPTPVQKQSKPEHKKKDEKPGTPTPVQKQTKPEDKKKDEKPGGPAPVQKQEKPANDKDKTPAAPLQRAVRPEDKKKEEVPGTLPVQRESADGMKKAETEPVQTSRSGSAAPASMESAASQAIATKGPGDSLAPATRSALESSMGTDLSDVRVHNDSRAQDAAHALNARAFTHGSDIWLGRGESQSDTRLMAHEATHVVQQTGSVHRMLVQRADGTTPSTAPGDTTPSEGPTKLETPTGQIDLEAKKMLLPKLEIPEFKSQFLKSKSDVTIKKGGEKRPSGAQSQRNIWKTQVGKTAEAAAEDRLKKIPGIRKAPSSGEEVKVADETTEDATKLEFLQIGAADNYLIGTPPELKTEFTIPRWGPDGKPRLLDVDHQLELQLGGENDISNMWLLDAKSNRMSGQKISENIRNSIIAAVQPHVGKPPFKEEPDPNLLRQQYEITYKDVNGTTQLNPPDKDAKWDRTEVEQVEKPLSKIKPLSAQEVTNRKLIGTATSLGLYPLATGGKKRDIKWDPKNTSEVPFNAEAAGFIGLSDAKIKYEPGKPGNYIRGTFTPKRATTEVKSRTITLPLVELGGIPYTVTLEKAGVLQAMRFAELYAFSPIEFDEISFEEGRGFVSRGKLMPTIPIFEKLDIDVVMDGNDVSLSRTFTAAEIKLPGPIKVPEAALTLSIGTSGVKATGIVLIEIERLGKGQITAGVGSGGGLELAGTFNFDTTLFDPANVHVEYKEGKFSGGGKIGIKPGKVRGIKTASIDASFSGDVIDAKGSIVPDIPAVEQADLSMHYDEKSGLTIAGDLQLKKDIPGIEDGSIHAEVTKKGDKYTVKASGEATPKIPGISSKLIVSYDDGLFDATVTAGYEKGMLKGSVTVGATNRPVGDDGKPAGEAPPAKSDKITIYGSGSATLQLAPWLQATAGIKFKPDGEVEVTGKIGLPAAINLFDEKKVEKNIFKIGIPIPIFPGISLNIGGGLDLNAGIGPGQLQEMEVDATYNPAHEDETTVHGHAALHIPAHAGLRLNVHAALDVGIPLAEVEGGIELGGTLGIEGALHAGVDIDWSPKKGLVLDASAEVYGEPKFKFDITGYVEVDVGVGPFSKTLWDKRWQLAAVEYGSGLRLGLKLPIHYEEGKPFNLSLSDIQFEYPNIDPMSVLKGLLDKIA